MPCGIELSGENDMGTWMEPYKKYFGLIIAACSECGESRVVDTYCSCCGSKNIKKDMENESSDTERQ